ncbi:MAG: adenosine deaminase [Petrimonas sp.]|nr:adenosine deaminase [Petrimonas sp.]
METNRFERYIKQIPKTELHMHIEGSLEPELMFELAVRNGVSLKYTSVEELKAVYTFSNLQEFLDIYYAGANVLITRQDFYDLTMAYMQKAHENGVVHAEIFFDAQTHTSRGIAFETVVNGISEALDDAHEKYGISSRLILCFLRHLDEVSAIETLQSALPFKDKISGVGLDSSEMGNPPSIFSKVFRMAQNEGFLPVAHAGEEGPAEYIREALESLNVLRIDHGIQAITDEKLLEELSERQIPLTVCPLSNLKLQVVSSLTQHPLKQLLDKGLLVTVNSDDPAYFGGYVNENYLQTANALNLSRKDIFRLAQNSFAASFLSDEEKEKHLRQLHEFDILFGDF